MIVKLPRDRWHELEQIFRDEFDSYLPHKDAAIVAEVDDDGNILGFVVVEFMMRIGQIYRPGDKGREMLKLIESQIPPDFAVIAIASDPRFETLCEKFGMTRCEGTVFRRDF